MFAVLTYQCYRILASKHLMRWYHSKVLDLHDLIYQRIRRRVNQAQVFLNKDHLLQQDAIQNDCQPDFFIHLSFFFFLLTSIMAKSTLSWTIFSFTKLIFPLLDSSAGVPNKTTLPCIKSCSIKVLMLTAQAKPWMLIRLCPQPCPILCFRWVHWYEFLLVCFLYPGKASYSQQKPTRLPEWLLENSAMKAVSSPAAL